MLVALFIFLYCCNILVWVRGFAGVWGPCFSLCRGDVESVCSWIPWEIWCSPYHHLYLQEELLAFLLHIWKLITQLACCHLVATGRFLIIYFFIFYYYNQNKQHKMLIKRQVAIGWLQTICVINFFMCRRKVIIFFGIKIWSEPSPSWVK